MVDPCVVAVSPWVPAWGAGGACCHAAAAPATHCSSVDVHRSTRHLTPDSITAFPAQFLAYEGKIKRGPAQLRIRAGHADKGASPHARPAWELKRNEIEQQPQPPSLRCCWVARVPCRTSARATNPAPPKGTQPHPRSAVAGPNTLSSRDAVAMPLLGCCWDYWVTLLHWPCRSRCR